jgi:hypothetical protein
MPICFQTPQLAIFLKLNLRKLPHLQMCEDLNSMDSGNQGDGFHETDKTPGNNPSIRRFSPDSHVPADFPRILLPTPSLVWEMLSFYLPAG